MVASSAKGEGGDRRRGRRKERKKRRQQEIDGRVETERERGGGIEGWKNGREGALPPSWSTLINLLS